MNIKAIYDNGGKTADRYTVYFDCIEKVQDYKPFWACLGMSDNPNSPLGFCQHSYGQLGKHNGKRIRFADLPAEHQAIVKDECGEPRQIKTAEMIAAIAESESDTILGQRRIVNREFRKQDYSALWPIRGKFSVIERAIRKARAADCDCALSYALTIDALESEIVNNSDNW